MTRAIDSSVLTQGFTTAEKNGFYAEFYDDGQLAHFGRYVDGSLENNWALYLADGEPTGRVERLAVHRFEPSWGEDAPPEGDDEESDPTATRFADWVAHWVGEIYASADQMIACSFCRKRQDEVRRIIAGPDVYICDECISLCQDILAEEGRESEQKE